MNEAIPKRWVGGICVKEGNVLLVHRINNERDFNKEYFVFPGNYIEEDESLEAGLLEEFDELSINVKVRDLFYSTEEADNDDAEYYYLCDYSFGEPQVREGSNEAEEMLDGKQVFIPMWVPIGDLEDLIVYPETLKEKIIEELVLED